MKKIYVATFHAAENHGAFLQTYASCEVLSKLTNAYEVKVLDYRPVYTKLPYKLDFPRFCKRNAWISYFRQILIFLYFLPGRLKRKWNFKKAQEELNLTVPIYDAEDVEKLTDAYAFFFGSDQVWNTVITKGIDRVFWGDFQTPAKKIAYSVSIGETEYVLDDKKKLQDLIADFEMVTVREASSIRILNQMCPREYYNTLDPTLLVDKAQWRKISKTPSEKNYILVYSLSNNPQILTDACQLGKKMGKKVVVLSEIGAKKRKNNHNVRSLFFVGPKEFVGLIDNAYAVFTDSFHGTCFSVIFQKDFYTYLGEKRNERIEDLAEMLNFKNRLVPYGQAIQNWSIVNNYEDIQNKLHIVRNQSVEQIKKIL